MADERRAVHAYLSDGSHAVLHDLADTAGVSLSGLLEALAQDLGAHPPGRGGHPRWDEVVQRARKVDAGRRRRART